MQLPFTEEQFFDLLAAGFSDLSRARQNAALAWTDLQTKPPAYAGRAEDEDMLDGIGVARRLSTVLLAVMVTQALTGLAFQATYVTVPRIGPSTIFKSNIVADTPVTSVVQRNVRPRNLPTGRTRTPGRRSSVSNSTLLTGAIHVGS